MQPPDYTFDADRLAALARYNILDTPAEPGFDDIVKLATLMCETPTALVSLVDSDRQWFKARICFELVETGLDSSVCAHALIEPGLLIIPDLSQDERTKDNPLVTGDPHIRFYAGAPFRVATDARPHQRCRDQGRCPTLGGRPERGERYSIDVPIYASATSRCSCVQNTAISIDYLAAHNLRLTVHYKLDNFKVTGKNPTTAATLVTITSPAYKAITTAGTLFKEEPASTQTNRFSLKRTGDSWTVDTIY